MANGLTNRGRYIKLGPFYQGDAMPTNLYVALCTNAVEPTRDTNTLSDLVEIDAGNGYTSGGFIMNRNATDFPTLVEDDVNNWATVTMRDIAITASGGPLPATGDGIRWIVLTDDNASIPARNVIAWWDLGSDFVVSDTQTLTFKGGTIRSG